MPIVVNNNFFNTVSFCWKKYSILMIIRFQVRKQLKTNGSNWHGLTCTCLTFSGLRNYWKLREKTLHQRCDLSLNEVMSAIIT
ncbi:MAG: hypothetical protein CSA22_09435 [Deltaproteobacteria bacterium]|nr:MAG: hypothetical protein CSA22_09435 [Deltaproteobacteria bacterium]